VETPPMRQPPELAEELPAFHVRSVAQKCARVNTGLPAPGAWDSPGISMTLATRSPRPASVYATLDDSRTHTVSALRLTGTS
jgi:hypothetical protein